MKDNLYRNLLNLAKKVCRNSYSPYSKFKVGAAVLCGNGSVFCGTNVENVSYGLSICAERAAVFNAVSNGCKEIKALAVYSPKGNITPCGACRQVITEFSKDAVIIYNINENEFKTAKISELLPSEFKMVEEPKS